MPLWMNGWQHSKKLIAPANQIDSDLSYFPMPVHLNNDNFDFSKAKPDGSDIRFTDKNLNPLKFERKEHTNFDYLYHLGNEDTVITGGWNKSSYVGTNYSFTKNANDITMNSTASGSGVRTSIATGINLSDYTKVKAEISTATAAGGGMRIDSVYPSTWAQSYVTSASNAQISSHTVIEIDVTALNGVYYIGFEVGSLGNLTIHKVWLEGKATSAGFASYNVLIPTVANTVDTDFYMWYGNPNAYNDSIEAWQDKTGKQLTYNGNVKLVPNVAKFGKAAYFDGTGDYLTVGVASDWNFLHQVGSGTGQWTFERWISISDFSTEHTLFDTTAGTSANNGAVMYLSATRAISVQITRGVAGSFVLQFISSDGVYPSDGGLHHLAVTYDQALASYNCKVYIDGKLVAQGTKLANAPSSSVAYKALQISGRDATNSMDKSYCDELRLSDIVRWTADFAPSQTPYTVDANTKLLLHFDDFDAMRISTSTTGTDYLQFTKTMTFTSSKTSAIEVTAKVESSGTTLAGGFAIANGSKATNMILQSGSVICNYTGTSPFTYAVDTSVKHKYKIEIQSTNQAVYYVDDSPIYALPYASLTADTGNVIWIGDAWGTAGSGGSVVWYGVKYNADVVGTPTAWVEWNPSQGLPTANGWTATGTASLATLTFKDETGKAVYTYGDVKPIKTAYADGARGAYFDGAGDYFQAGQITDWNFLHQVGTTGKWTAELNFRAQSFATAQMFFSTSAGSSAYHGIGIYITAARAIGAVIHRGVSGQNTCTGVSADGVYPNDTANEHKIKVTYDQALASNNMKIYIDDVLVLQATKTANTPSSSVSQTNMNIGTYNNGAGDFVNGNVLGCRLSNGICRDAEIQPSKFDVDQYTVFCTNFDTIYDQNYLQVQHVGMLVDAVGNGVPYNVSEIATSLVNTDLGKARRFNGSWLDFNSKIIPNGAKTIMMTMKNSVKPSVIAPFIQTHDSNLGKNGYYMFANPNGTVGFAVYGTTTSNDYLVSITEPSDIYDGQFHVLGVSSAGNTTSNGVKMYLDGIVKVQGTQTRSDAEITNVVNPRIGGTANGSSYYANIDAMIDIRTSNIVRSASWMKAESLALKNQLLTISEYIAGNNTLFFGMNF